MNRDEWNAQVESVGGHIFQTYHWAEVMELLGVQPVPFTSQHSLMMAYQAQFLRARRLGVQVNSLTIERGPVFDRDAYDETDFRRMINEVDEYAKNHKVAFCSFSPALPFGNSASQVFQDQGFKHVPNAEGYHTQTYVVNLTDREDRIFSRMEKRTRWSIRKAERKNVTVEEEDAPNIFYALYRSTVPSPQPESFFSLVFKMLEPKGLARVFVARLGSSSVAAAFLLLCGKCMWYTWGGSDPKLHDSCGSSLLHWRIMQWGKEHGYEFYDLGGALVDESEVSHADAKLVSGSRFKRGFGGYVVKYLGQYRKQYGKLGKRTIETLGTIAQGIYRLR